MINRETLLKHLENEQVENLVSGGDNLYLLNNRVLLSIEILPNGSVSSYELETGGGKILYSPDSDPDHGLAYLDGAMASIFTTKNSSETTSSRDPLKNTNTAMTIVEALGRHASSLNFENFPKVSMKLQSSVKVASYIDVAQVLESLKNSNYLRNEYSGNSRLMGYFLAGYLSVHFDLWDEF